MIKINKEKLLKIWNIIKNINAILSIIMFIMIIVVFVVISTHKMTLNIEENCTAATVKDIPLKMPITFLWNKAIIKGEGDVVMSKAVILPVRIKLKVPLDIINILDHNMPVSISIE